MSDDVRRGGLVPLVAGHLKRQILAPRLRRWSDRLRGYADELDPLGADGAPADVKIVSREELRQIQNRGIQMIEDCIWLFRQRGRDDGLLWMPHEILSSIAWLMEVELEVRERDFATIEKDPTTVLR